MVPYSPVVRRVVNIHAPSSEILEKKHAPPRPFPWRCITCGSRSVELGRTSYDAQVRFDDRLHTFNLPDLKIPICAACGERIFTGAVDEQINAALRRHLSLLTPEEIRESLASVGLSQEELASRLRIPATKISYWIDGVQIQSGAMDTLLRLYFGLPAVREALESGVPEIASTADAPEGLPDQPVERTRSIVLD